MKPVPTSHGILFEHLFDSGNFLKCISEFIIFCSALTFHGPVKA